MFFFFFFSMPGILSGVTAAAIPNPNLQLLMELWLIQVWKAEIIQTPYTEFDRCLLYCQLFNKAPLWLVHRNVVAHAEPSFNVQACASVMGINVSMW